MRVFFRPPIPELPPPNANHSALLAIIDGRLVEAAYHDGKGIDLTMKEIKDSVIGFMERYINNRSLPQLRAIAGIPHSVMDYDYLRSTGLISDVGTMDNCFIYYKFVTLSRHSVWELSKSERPVTSKIAMDVLALLDANDIDHNEPVHIFHVGRSVTGLNNRKGVERMECKRKIENPTKTYRPWIEATSRAPNGANSIKYSLLADLSRLTGIERSERLVRNSHI